MDVFRFNRESGTFLLTVNKGEIMAKETLIIDHTVYETELTDTYRRSRAYELKDRNYLNAFLPGLIAEVKVKVGDVVKAGSPLLILEAMKMLNEIDLTYDVKVEEIFVKVGDIVSKNQILMKVEQI